jgi:hypothetical protein
VYVFLRKDGKAVTVKNSEMTDEKKKKTLHHFLPASLLSTNTNTFPTFERFYPVVAHKLSSTPQVDP